MTRDELVEKVAKAICKDWGYIWDGDEDDMQTLPEIEQSYDERPSKHLFRLAASSVIDTIFEALKKPTDEMGDAWATVSGINYKEGWQAMLNASPLAKEG